MRLSWHNHQLNKNRIYHHYIQKGTSIEEMSFLVKKLFIVLNSKKLQQYWFHDSQAQTVF